MKALEAQDIIDLHIKKFGVEPIITGVNFNDSLEIFENILQAIEDGIPYTEKEVPNGVLT
jgi:hypothetical protein